MYLFDVASRHMTWLSERQAIVASNIANSDTPGYRSQDAQPFSMAMAASSMSLDTTSPGHLQIAGEAMDTVGRQSGEMWDMAHSGNTVSVEKELMAAGANSRMMNLDVTLERSFQRMLLASMKV